VLVVAIVAPRVDARVEADEIVVSGARAQQTPRRHRAPPGRPTWRPARIDARSPPPLQHRAMPPDQSTHGLHGVAARSDTTGYDGSSASNPRHDSTGSPRHIAGSSRTASRPKRSGVHQAGSLR
jgi:hypothetical protein